MKKISLFILLLFICASAQIETSSRPGGKITRITAGNGLLGGGYINVVTIYVDTSVVAMRDWVLSAISDSSGTSVGDSVVTWLSLATAVQDSVQKNNRISANGVGWAMLATAVQDSIHAWNTYLADNTVGLYKLDTAATGIYDVRKFGAVGDSTTDNAAAIRAALKHAHNAGGGVVFFPGGPETIYGIKDTVKVYSNLTLTSDGAWVKKLSSSTLLNLFTMNGATNVTFDHFNIDGNEKQENVIIGGCNNLKVTNCKIKNAGSWSVRSIQDTNVVIADNMFWNCATPIGIWSVKNCRVERNLVDNRLYDGDTFGGVEAGITVVTATDMWIVGNMWYRDTDSTAATACESVYINDASGVCSNITIADNKIYCYAGNQFGISLSASAHGIQNAWITGNYIEGSRTIGAIEPGGVDNLTISGNIIKDTFGSADIALNGSCNNVKITSNQFINSPYAAIWGQPLHTDIIIDGNVIHGSATSYGISLESVNKLLISNNVIDSVLTAFGVSGHDITIFNNQCNYVTGGNGAVGVNSSHNVIISNNTFNACGNSGFATIFTSGTYDLKLTGNKLYKCNRFLYDGGYGNDRVTISDNTIMYNTAEAYTAISLTGSRGAIITDNKMIGGDIAFVSLASASSDTVYAPRISGNTIIADSTTAERSHNSISVASVKNAEISNNRIYIKRGYDAWSWVPLVTLSGNSDSCVVKNNTITGDSVAVWATTAIYLADSTADHNIISGNVIRGFDKGIHNNSNRSGNIVTDNEVTNCTTPYEQAGGAIGIRSRYYSASDSSLAFIIWNPTLARADTVFAKQP